MPAAVLMRSSISGCMASSNFFESSGFDGLSNIITILHTIYTINTLILNTNNSKSFISRIINKILAKVKQVFRDTENCFRTLPILSLRNLRISYQFNQGLPRIPNRYGGYSSAQKRVFLHRRSVSKIWTFLYVITLLNSQGLSTMNSSLFTIES